MDDFCQYNLFKKARPHLLKPPPYVRESEGRREKKTCHLQLKSSDPAKLLLLCESLKEHSTRDLEVKINEYLIEETNSQTAFLIKLLVVPGGAVIRVIGSTILALDIHLPISDELIVTIMESKDGVEFSLELLNPQLCDVIKSVVPDIMGTVYAFPVFEQNNTDGETTYSAIPTLLICIINCSLQKIFVSNLVQETFRFVQTLVNNTTKMEEETRTRQQYEAVLNMARKLFTKLANLNELLKEVSEHMLELTDSEKCTLYLIDRNRKQLDQLPFAEVRRDQIKVAKDKGVQGMVYTTGALLNIRDAQENSIFNKSLDPPGFKTKNILCFPIKNEEDVIGVAQLVNKRFGDYNHYDEETVELLGLVCGISINHALFVQSVEDELTRNRFSTVLTTYHSPVKIAEVKHVFYGQKPPCPNFGDCLLNPRTIPLHQTPLLVLKMFEDLKFIETYGLNKKYLAGFIATVQRAHRHEPYHNWRHSFCATYFAYSCIVSHNMINKKCLTELEAMAMLTALMCLNVDHRGAGGMFRGMPWTTLASLFSSNGSISERYCLSQTLAILNSEGCNFLELCTPKLYANFLEHLKMYILHTDLSLHVKNLKRLEILVVRGFRHNILEDRNSLQALLVICSMFSDQIRDWKTSREITAEIYQELFLQIDVEKEMGKQVPALMDRNKACIPDLQIDFLRDTILPAFTIFVKLLPNLVFCVDAILLNIRFWEAAKRFFIHRPLQDSTSLDILHSNVLSFTESQIGMLGEASEEETLSENTTYYEPNEVPNANMGDFII